MTYLAISIAVGALGVVAAILMLITVVGVCRFRKGYRRFFDRFRTLHVVPAIREVARIYLVLLNRFLGPDVGFRYEGGLTKTKIVGWYLEHLLLLYWIGGTILVLSFRPADPMSQTSSSLSQAAAFTILLLVNVVSDAVSLLWTKRCIGLLVSPVKDLRLPRALWILAQDILVAVGLMFAVQFVSNGLYAIQIGHSELFFDYMLNPYTALKPYAPVDPRFSYIRFPGQLIITCTTYVPSLLFYFLCLLILALSPFARLAFWMLYIFRLDRGTTGCTQLGFIGSIIAVLSFGAGCFVAMLGGLSFIANK